MSVCSILVRVFIKNQETKSFKKRYNIGYKFPKLIFGEYSLTLLKSYNIEFIYLFNFKRLLKKYYNFKKMKLRKVWLFLPQNYPITKKSKNARMGKGKGSVARYCSRVWQNHNLFEFRGFNVGDVYKLKTLFQRKLKIPISIYTNFFITKYTKYHVNKVEMTFTTRKYYL